MKVVLTVRSIHISFPKWSLTCTPQLKLKPYCAEKCSNNEKSENSDILKSDRYGQAPLPSMKSY